MCVCSFSIFFSILIYYRIMNTVPCAVQYRSLLFTCFIYSSLSSQTPNLSLPAPFPSGNCRFFCVSSLLLIRTSGECSIELSLRGWVGICKPTLRSGFKKIRVGGTVRVTGKSLERHVSWEESPIGHVKDHLTPLRNKMCTLQEPVSAYWEHLQGTGAFQCCPCPFRGSILIELWGDCSELPISDVYNHISASTV